MADERPDAARLLGRVGIWVNLDRASGDELRSFARELEALGYRALWFPETVAGKEAFSLATFLLLATTRLTAATGIANLWARDPMAMANGARALAEWSGGRFVLGIGVSHAPSIATRGGGGAYAHPFERMTEYLDAMDAAKYNGPGELPPLLLAALGPRMLRLAAKRAAGAHPYFVPVEHTTLARRALGPGKTLAVEQAVVLETDPEKARAIARVHTRRYLSLENYTNNLRRLGFSDRDILPEQGGSDRLVDAIVAWGDVAAAKRRVDDHRARGADHVCVQILRADRGLPSAEARALARVLID